MFTESLNQIFLELDLIAFELTLLSGALLILVVDLIFKNQLVSQVIYVLSILLAMYLQPFFTENHLIFTDALAQDELVSVVRLILGLSSLWIVFYPGMSKYPGEFYFLLLSVLAGSSLMLSANNLLVIYLAIELTSFAGYVLTNFNFEKRSFEAGMKYLIFGGISSAIGLYGASWIYGLTGTLTLTEMDLTPLNDPLLLNISLIMFLGAVLFKVSAFPFHIWVPGTYQAAPTSGVAILSILPKIGGVILLHRLLYSIEFMTNEWLYGIVIGIGITTILVGTFGAIAQTNVKRLIAYGAIAHSGFLLIPIFIPFQNGATAFLWYASIYAVMNVMTFYLVALFEEQGRRDLIDFQGLYNRDSYMGGMLLLVMVSLIGLPPTAGFTAKFYLFSVTWDWYQTAGDVSILIYLIIAVLSIVVSLFYYLKIPYFFYFKEPIDFRTTRSTFSQRFIATILGLVLLWLFFSPELLNNIAESIKFIHW